MHERMRETEGESSTGIRPYGQKGYWLQTQKNHIYGLREKKITWGPHLGITLYRFPTLSTKAQPISALDGKLSFTFHKTQAYSITKGIFYPSFFIMKLFDKTTEYCQCD